MNTETATPKSNLGQHVDDLRRDAGNVAQDLKQQAQSRIQDVKDQAQTRLQDAKEEASARLAQAKVTANDLFESLRAFVAEHPLTTFGAGIVLGIFLASRGRR